MKIGNVDTGNRPLIIAEVGNNHEGSAATAKELTRKAADGGADAVKFQTFNPKAYVHESLPPPPHARGKHKTQQERLASIALTQDDYRDIKRLADELGILFLSTPFDHGSLEFLDDLVPAFKIASGDLTNVPLLELAASKGKPIILSTGMANESEIASALEILARCEVTLLHCVARYPAPVDSLNLLSIPYLRDRFGVPVGYSDHSLGIAACKTAAALGAVVIEKHFTLDKSQPVGDHKLSMDPDDLAELVASVRQTQALLGSYGLFLSDEELQIAQAMRRSLYASVDIPAGTVLAADMVVALRPPKGLPPGSLKELIGKKAKSDIPAGALLALEMLE